MRPGGGRAKGHAFERLVVLKLREAGFSEARRNLSQTRTAKQEGPDILGVPGMWLELSHSAANVEAQKWKQAVADSDAWNTRNVRRDDWADTINALPSVEPMAPVVVTKRNRQPATVLLQASTLDITNCPGDVMVRLDLDEWLRVLSHRRHAGT